MNKRLALVLLVASVSLLPWPPTLAVAQSQAILKVEVRPEAQIAAPSSLVWAAGAPTLQIPLNVKLRLNPGTSAELTVTQLDQGGTLENAILEVEGKAGLQVVSGTPVVVRDYLQSGTFRDSLVVRLASPLLGASHQVVLRVRLSFSDGSVERVQTIQLQLQEGLVSQVSVPPAL
jgi:hypothetical protein